VLRGPDEFTLELTRRKGVNFQPPLTFLAFPVEIRKIIYTTNAIESLNYQLRKVTKARGSFPSDAAALKLLYLAIRNINQKRGNQGQGTYRWTEALNTFAIQFPDRLPL
jgi:putative transposase